ncbi:MAG: LamG-like jellyroll fold domain-containing protein [Flavobacterium sp.]|jgi:hypothetical protein
MKQKYFLLKLIFLLSLVSFGQTSTLSYNDDIYTSSYPSVTLNNFTTCQTSASIVASSQGYTSVWADRNYSLIVNGTNIGTFIGTQTIDITSYIPITSVQMNSSHYSWSWVDLTVNITSLNSSMPASGPTVSNVTYVQGDTASPLTATLTGTGTTLKWYTDAAGDNYSTTGSTPSTTTIGTTSYFVAQANSSGCESVRSEIVVTVVANTPATHLNFDGVNDFVVSTNATTNNTENQTYQAWIKIPSLPVATNKYRIFQRGIDGTGAGWSLALDVLDSGRLQALYVNSAASGNSVNGTTILSPNTWYHVSMVFENNNSIRIYLNGTLEGNLSIGNMTLRSSDSKIRIGRGNLSTEYFRGDVDDVRIWNKVLSQDYIMNTMNCELPNGEANLVVYYKFNQGIAEANNSGITSATDATTNANNGILTNFALTGSTSNWLVGSPVTTGSLIPENATVTSPVTYNQGDSATALTATTGTNGTGLLWYTTATGGIGNTTAPTPSTSAGGSTSYWVSSTNANGCESERVEIVVNVNSQATHLNFDGTDDFVISANAITTNTENQTYQALFRIPSIPTNSDAILQRGIDGTGGWSVQIGINTSGRLYAGISATPDTFVTGTTVLSPNTWYHVTFVFENNNSLRLYLDGNLEASVAIGNRTLRNSDNRLRVGSGNVASEYFRGDIDEVRVWNKVISSTDILNTMNCELQASENGLKAYYKLNQGFENVNNSSVTSATDSSGNGNDGTLTNFTLNGTSSNWLVGSALTTGNTCATLGNSDFNVNNTFKVYPNPSKGIFNITSDEALTIEIYDVVGKLVKTVNTEIGNQSLDITNLNSGIYILKTINTNNAKQVFKIIKE